MFDKKPTTEHLHEKLKLIKISELGRTEKNLIILL